MKYTRLLFIALLLINIGCENKENGFVPKETALIWEHGYNAYNQIMDDTLRNFVIHVPTSYSHSNDAVPVVIMLHGSSGDGDRFYNISGWKEKAEEEGFIAVFPTALQYPIDDKNDKLTTKWADDALINEITPGTFIKDDIPYIREVVDHISATFHINPRRIYVAGFSGGGGMVRDKLIIEANDLFAAAATAGGFSINEVKQIPNQKYLPLYCFLGTKDEKIIESSGWQGNELPLDAASFFGHEIFWDYLGNILHTLKVDTIYTENRNPPATNTFSFVNDLSGQGNEYHLTLVNELGHSFPNGKNNKHNVSGPDILWDWFMKFEK